MINLNSKCILKMVFVGSFIVGNSWSQWRSAGISAENVTTVAAIPGAILAGTDDQGIFSSSDNGANWTARSSGLPKTTGLPITNNTIASMTANTNYVFAGTDRRGIFRSTCNGTTWTAINNGFPDDVGILNLAIRNSKIFASVGSFSLNGIFCSMDNGESWSLSSREIPNYCMITSLVVNNSDIYAAGDNCGIYQLKENGTRWIPINAGLPTNCLWRSLLINDNIIYAGTNDSGMFVSSNNGASWSSATNGLTNKHINALASYGPIIFAGTWEGGKVFFSCNKGKRWAPLDTGSMQELWCINFLEVISNTLYAGTYSSGLLKLSLDSIPDALYASNKSCSTYKIPVSGDTLNYGYTLLDAPADMSMSPGGTIAWTPKNDSSYITQVDYLVIDDNGKRDTSSFLVFVNGAAQAGNKKQASSKTKAQPDISIIQNPGSRNCTINLPGNFLKSDIYIYNLAGRIIDKLSGNNGTSILWQPRSVVEGSYILLVKNGAEQWTKQFFIR